MRFGYSSANANPGAKLGEFDPFEAPDLGRGWRHTFETRILPEGGLSEVRLLQWDGSIETWLQTTNDANGSLYQTRHKEYRGELRRFLGGDFEWTTPERLVYRYRNPFPSEFDAPPDDPFLLKKGFLEQIRDFNGNVVRVTRDQLGKISQVTDTAGGPYLFTYTNNVIRSVSFGPWSVNFTYTYDSTNRLISKSVTNTSGLYPNVPTTWQFAYNANGLLERITDPCTNRNIWVEYDKYGRKTNEVDALGRTTRTAYAVPGKRQIKHTDPEGKDWLETYDRKGRILAQRDPLTKETRYTYDEFGNRASITEPLGWKTLFAYDSRANVVARTNALGEVSRWVFHTNSLPDRPHINKPIMEITPQPLDVNGQPYWTNLFEIDNSTGNLLRHYDALGDLVRYEYHSSGLVTNSVNARGFATKFAYDTNGFLVARSEPFTNGTSFVTTTFGYNEVGWRLAETNALGQFMSYSLDLNGNVVRTVDPLQRVFTKTYDGNGNVLTASDAKGQITSFAYDAANQKTTMVDRAGNTWAYTYTPRGKLERAIDPLGNTVTNFYDTANRLERISDPLGNSVTNMYDANGNLVALLDKLGQRWTKTYDRLNRVVAESDPLGNTKRTTFDPAGRIKEIFTPRGYLSLHSYDGRGRLTKWIDAEGFNWLYDYDGVGDITNITDALGGHYVMAYGPRNERTLEKNQDGFEWRYTYDELLRLKTQRDPNGTTRTLNYDAGGRILSLAFNTGRVNAFAYDDNNNPEVLSRTGSGPPTISQLAYDAMDRVIEYRDAFGKRIRYTYDKRGKLDTLTYPDGKTLTHRFDPIGRLTNQVFQFSPQQAHGMSYEYDRADRLIRRTYPNGVIQTNSFDTAGRITNLTYQASSIQNPASSNQISIALTYAYDKNGNKTGSTEHGTLNWSIPSLTDETARYTKSGRLIDRQITPLDTLNSQPSTLNYHYDPSGNMTNATGNGQGWSLTYDEDNRTTSIRWDSGLTAKNISNRYDALGRRIAKTVDGIQTGYALDLSGSMERILCDLNAAGAITAWYVHGADLSFKVAPDGSLTCYNADAMANVIALTGASGTNTAQYAYTPYGRSLVSTNQQSQIPNPYLFVGSQGVMEELPGLCFLRARYYSADAAIFISTDPVKHIGPRWKPTAYSYVGGNPISKSDPRGLFEWWGNYGGPGWTGGQKITYDTTAEWYDAEGKGDLPLPVDAEDWAYYYHDLSYAEGRTAGDSDLFRRADQRLVQDLQRVREQKVHSIEQFQKSDLISTKVKSKLSLVLKMDLRRLDLAIGLFEDRVDNWDYRKELSTKTLNAFNTSEKRNKQQIGPSVPITGLLCTQTEPEKQQGYDAFAKSTEKNLELRKNKETKPQAPKYGPGDYRAASYKALNKKRKK